MMRWRGGMLGIQLYEVWAVQETAPLQIEFANGYKTRSKGECKQVKVEIMHFQFNTELVELKGENSSEMGQMALNCMLGGAKQWDKGWFLSFIGMLLQKSQNVPSKFSKVHLPNTKIQITLHNLKGEQWTVNAVPTTKLHSSHTMCGGWLDFVRGNDIKLGDVCIFELIGKCELRVRIAEVGKDGLEDSQIGKQASSTLGARHDVVRNKTSSSRYKPKSSKFSSKYRKKVVASDKKLSKIGQEAVLSIELKKSDVGKEGLDNQNGHMNEP
ncbi:B3 domain-containing protein [Trifolium pratense]|uniref:B3 domain-containing protein n=1 Tax=Trifolium pratense TaxID=57577 RepID=A0A2K3PDN9_TRIPR|nr:B3 domain-containing protein [Trifolium pratense]